MHESANERMALKMSKHEIKQTRVTILNNCDKMNLLYLGFNFIYLQMLATEIKSM